MRDVYAYQTVSQLLPDPDPALLPSKVTLWDDHPDFDRASLREIMALADRYKPGAVVGVLRRMGFRNLKAVPKEKQSIVVKRVREKLESGSAA